MPRHIRGAPSTLGHSTRLPSGYGGAEIRRALCPCCGMFHGYRREVISGVVVGRESYWRFERDPNKPFGIVQTTMGRGTMSVGTPFSPEEDQDEFYPQVKYHLLAALEEWLAKGWLTTQELEGSGISVPGKAAAAPRVTATVQGRKPRRLTITEQRQALTSKAGASLGETKEVLQELLDDLEEKRSNLEEHFSGTERYTRFEEAVSALEEMISSIEEVEGSVESLELP